MTRTPIPLPTERAVLVKSRRRCCLCFWIDGIDENQRGQIAHLDGDRDNHNEENLCWLCLPHHDEYDTTRSQSRGFRIGEVKQYRRELYKEMELRFYALEVERKLRRSKQAIRRAAHRGLMLRVQAAPSREAAKEWQADAVLLVKRLAGDPAEFDFIHCTQGCGAIDLATLSGVRAYLYIHGDHLKELARTMDATDLIETGEEQGAPADG